MRAKPLFLVWDVENTRPAGRVVSVEDGRAVTSTQRHPQMLYSGGLWSLLQPQYWWCSLTLKLFRLDLLRYDHQPCRRPHRRSPHLQKQEALPPTRSSHFCQSPRPIAVSNLKAGCRARGETRADRISVSLAHRIRWEENCQTPNATRMFPRLANRRPSETSTTMRADTSSDFSPTAKYPLFPWIPSP